MDILDELSFELTFKLSSLVDCLPTKLVTA